MASWISRVKALVRCADTAIIRCVGCWHEKGDRSRMPLSPKIALSLYRFRAIGPVLSLPLDTHRNAHTAANAEGREALARIAAAHLVEQGCEDAGA